MTAAQKKAVVADFGKYMKKCKNGKTYKAGDWEKALTAALNKNLKGGRVKKDPNAPKRPMTAFFYFSMDIKPQIKKKHPDMKMTDIAKEAGARWKKLSDKKKAPFQKMADKDKIRYQKEMDKYNKKSKPKVEDSETEDSETETETESDTETEDSETETDESD